MYSVIRRLEETDYNKEYLQLLKQLTSVDPDKISRKDFKEFMENLNENHMIFVIEDLESKIIIGTITILIEKKIIHNLGIVVHIEDLVIHMDYRKKGLGNKLLEFAKGISKECKAYKIILDCSNELEIFYNKHDFKKMNIQMALYN